MGYTAGTLDLSILGESNSAVASIDKTVKSLNSLSRAITKINNLPVLSASNNLSMFFTKIAESTSKIDTASLDKLASSTKALSSISKISKLDNMDWDKTAQGFSKLNTAITPFINKVKEAETSLNSLYSILNKSSGKNIGNLLNGNVGTSKNGKFSFGTLLNLGKWTAVIYAGRKLGRVMADIVTKGSDFGETLNLWQVAIGDEFLPQATEFVDKLNEAYGISKKTLMNSQAIFKNMLGSLGQISTETAYELSEGVTQMALDYASLYNVQFEEAMTKFQAALAGQVRPIRSVAGYDITENTLFQLYQSLGGEKTMRQLSRTEKQLLAIYAVFEQMESSGAVGDLDNTIESFANQSRIMSETWKSILTYSGLIVTRLLENYNVMQYINATLIFASRVLEEFANRLGAGRQQGGNIFEDITSGAQDAIDETEKLKSTLLDFDKFRALDQSSEQDSLGLDQNLIDAVTKYDSILSNAGFEAENLADEWIESLGGIDEIVDNIFEKLDKLDDVKEYLDDILLIIGGIAFVNALSNIYDTIENIVSVVETLKQHPIIAIIGAVIILLTALYNSNEDFRESVDALADELTPVLGTLSALIMDILNPLIDVLKELGGYLAPIITKVVEIYTKVVPYLVVTLSPLIMALETIAKVLETIDVLLTSLLSANWDTLGDKIAEIWKNWGEKTNDFVTKAQEALPFANGGLPDKGTVFVAGEAGAEYVYNMPSGQSGVANVQQIAQATYSGTMRALNEWWGGSGAKGDIPQLKEANATGLYQVVTGVANSQGKVWANV